MSSKFNNKCTDFCLFSYTGFYSLSWSSLELKDLGPFPGFLRIKFLVRFIFIYLFLPYLKDRERGRQKNLPKMSVTAQVEPGKPFISHRWVTETQVLESPTLSGCEFSRNWIENKGAGTQPRHSAVYRGIVCSILTILTTSHYQNHILRGSLRNSCARESSQRLYINYGLCQKMPALGRMDLFMGLSGKSLKKLPLREMEGQSVFISTPPLPCLQIQFPNLRQHL